MASDNRRLLAKADYALSELTTDGALNEQHADKFIEDTIHSARFLGDCTAYKMTGSTEVIPVISLADQFMHAATPATELQVNQRSKPVITSVKLTPFLFKGTMRLDNETLEDNIEGKALQDRILRMLPKRIGRDIENFILRSDTDNVANPDFSQFDGVLKSANAHDVDFDGERFNVTDMSLMIDAVPLDYKELVPEIYRFYTSHNAVENYRNVVSQRETQLGDAALTGKEAIRFKGIPVIAAAGIPTTLGGTSNRTVALLCNPKDVYVGFWRNITFETQYDALKGAVYLIATVRVDAKIPIRTAIVQGIDILN